jgi:hypothetical protein
MTIRLAVVSTTRVTDRMLEALPRLSGGAVEVVLHLGTKDAPFRASSLSRLKASDGVEGHVMSGSRYSGAAEALFSSDDYFRARDEFVDHMTRTSALFKAKSHELTTLDDYHGYFHVLCDTLAQQMTERGVTHVLFFTVPHLGYDTAMRHLARAMGLRVLILSQQLFPDCFASLADPAAIGCVAPVPDAPPHPIKKGEQPPLFYMKGVKQEREASGRLSLKAIGELVVFLLLKRRWRALDPVYVYRLVRHMQRIYASFPKWRDPFAEFFHEHSLAYFDHLAAFEDQEIDLSGDYVYVPLQMQPEMTTSTLGGRFRDQAYAIERLAGLLPPGVRILVKENPKQGAYMRGPLFFHRLKRIPAVTFLPSYANTHALTAHARFVATITGTVGWEALCMGKPVLVFGQAWYRGFPGVQQWREGLSYDEIVATPVDHAALEAAVGGFVARCHRGVVDGDYIEIVDGYSEDANVDRVAAVIADLLTGKLLPTFQLPLRDAATALTP